VVVFQFFLLGLASGAAYTLLGQSIVLVHRGSNVLNFAAGAIGVLGAYVFYDMWNGGHGMPWPLCLGVGLACAGTLGLAVHYMIIRRLANASPLSRVVATLGLLSALMAFETLIFAPNNQAEAVSTIFPAGEFRVGSIYLAWDQLGLALLGIAVTVAIAVWCRKTRMGLAIGAVAENPLVSASMGWSPSVVAGLTWTLGSMIAAVGVIFVASISSLSVVTLSLMVVPGMAAALVGDFRSLPRTLLGGMAIGVAQSELARYVAAPGWSQAAPLVLIVVVLAVKGAKLPDKTQHLARLPSVGPGSVGWGALVWLGIGALSLCIVSLTWVAAITTTLLAAIVVVSIVFVVGYAGQLSLAQVSIAGVSAYLMALLCVKAGLPAFPAILVAALLTVPVGLVIAAPALRTRGSNLAIATLGLVVVIDALLLNNPDALNPVAEGQLPTLSLFGLDVSEVDYPRVYGIIVLAVLVLASLAVSNIRRSRSGRRILAVRNNERAAAALGISGPSVKMFAFGTATLIAGVAGGLTESQFLTPDFSLFTITSSIDSVLQAVVGGLGWVSGAAIGASNAPGGVSSQILNTFFTASSWLDIITGVLVILIVLQSADGLAPLNISLFHKTVARLELRPRQARSRRERVPRRQSTGISRPPCILRLEGITVRFGGQTALNDVSLEVRPGEVVGLIGPNGAGKSTLIDVASGFQLRYSGHVYVDGHGVDAAGAVARGRLGVGRSFQSLELFEQMTVLDNLRTAGERATPWRYLADFIHPAAGPAPEVLQTAAEFSLGDVLHKKVEELGYARRHVVAIARSFAAGPGVLLLDEPAAGLDQAEKQALAHVLKEVVAVRGIGVLLVEHDIDFVFGLCDRVVALDAGDVIAQGLPAEVRQSSAVIEAYLGSGPGSLPPAAADKGQAQESGAAK
jgi:ABC-type branched-subunit amino acid transport system ATPase component/branched-subunit amino acid ABC-type transport system permease component